jgi:hypothetical protein
VAGQRLLAPPSNFSKEGGLRKRVFSGVVIAPILPFMGGNRRLAQANSQYTSAAHWTLSATVRVANFTVPIRI